MRFHSQTVLITAVAMTGAGVVADGTPLDTAQSSYTISINPFSPWMAGFQYIDGFGFSLASQRANLITNMSNKTAQRELLDLLFNQTSGAGFSILHNVIGSSPDSASDHMNSIEPNEPASPEAAPEYVWDGKDSGQLWVSQQAVNLYGVNTIYANAFSAPGFMKTNHLDTDGGFLCGAPGTNCTLGSDWRHAYANYLVTYTKLYSAAGVNITHLGPYNEPDRSPPNPHHASMQSTPAQATDLLPILQTALDAAGLAGQVGIACCDTQTGSADWETALPDLKAATAHSLPPSSAPAHPVRFWLTAQPDSAHNTPWPSAWYDTGAPSEGLSWANRIFDAVVDGNASAVLYGAAGVGSDSSSSEEEETLIRILDTRTGAYAISPRLWALAHFARFLRPGALQRGCFVSSSSSSSSGDGNGENGDGGPLRAAAFQNWGGPNGETMGPMAVVVINNAATAASVQLQMAGSGFMVGAAQGFVTDATRNCSVLDGVVLDASEKTSAVVPARSVTTFLFTTFIFW